MILRSLLLASCLALQALAFLVPAEIANDVAAAAKDLSPASWTSNAELVVLPCPGCIFQAADGAEEVYTEADENVIAIQVRVEDAERLQINERTVYPFYLPLSPVTLTAYQWRKVDGRISRPLTLGYALEFLPPVHSNEEDIIARPIEFTILDLDGIPVTVDTVRIDLVQSDQGLSLAKVTTIPFKETPGAEECTSSLCRLRAIVAARLRAVLDVAKAKADAATSWMNNKGGCKGRNRKHGGWKHPGHKTGDEEHHPHRHHGHFHKMHHIGHIVRQILRFLVVPALLGVVGGLMASAVGMLVGQAIVYAWLRFHRHGERGNASATEVAIHDEEKDLLVDGEESEDLPPKYEDVEVIVVPPEEEKSSNVE